MTADEENVEAFPAAQANTAIMVLADLLNRAKKGEVEDVVVVAREPNGHLEVEWSDTDTGGVSEACHYLQGHVIEFIDQMNCHAVEEEEDPEGA